MFNDLLILIATSIILVEIYRKLRQIWLGRLLSQKKKDKRARKPPILHLKSERDCHFCQEDKWKKKTPDPETPIPWHLRKGKGGPKKKVSTEGYFCPNESCKYYGISDEGIHALVGYGRHGLHEEIRDIKCQACGKKFTARRNTVLYRLKSPSGLVVSKCVRYYTFKPLQSTNAGTRPSRSYSTTQAAGRSRLSI